MQIHDLVQGSAEWHAYRAGHFNASDAPAMMGVSPYKTRSQLLHEMHTGIAQEVDAATQRRFDDGHRFEALARPLAEEIIGQDLYPVVGSEGKYSASFDGLTMAEDIGFEHKSLNQELREIMEDGDCGARLPKHYRIQMEQQCMVSGALRILFMASKWDGEDLVEERHCWYYVDLDLRAEIMAGWEQFEKDLASYVPAETVEKPQAAAIMTLPALSVLIRGEVVSSNLPAFRDAAQQFIANIKTELATDEDFANAEATAKFCEKAEKDLELAKNAAIAQTASIDELMRTIDYIKGELRSKRLTLEKAVTTKKAEIKEAIILEARKAYQAHVTALENEISLVRLSLPAPDFSAAAKNKRTLASLQDAVNTALAQAKIDADTQARDVRAKLHWFSAQAVGFTFLFADLQQVIGKPVEDFQMLVNTRIEQHKQAEERRQREAAEAAERDKAAAAHAASIVQDVAPRAQEALAEQPAVSLGEVLHAAAPAAIAQAMVPNLRLGQIGERLGFNLTADFLRELGIEPADKQRGAVLYHEHDFDRICGALIARISQVRTAHRMAEAA